MLSQDRLSQDQVERNRVLAKSAIDKIITELHDWASDFLNAAFNYSGRQNLDLNNDPGNTKDVIKVADFLTQYKSRFEGVLITPDFLHRNLLGMYQVALYLRLPGTYFEDLTRIEREHIPKTILDKAVEFNRTARSEIAGVKDLHPNN